MARHAITVHVVLALMTLTRAYCQSPSPAPVSPISPGSNNSPDTGSTVGPQPPPTPASSIPYLLAQTEADQRRQFPTSDFAFAFDSPDTSTPGGNLSGLVSMIIGIVNAYFSYLGLPFLQNLEWQARGGIITII